MADLLVEQLSGFGLATIMARKGVSGMAIGMALGVEAPAQPAFCRGENNLALIGTGAGSWFAHTDMVSPAWHTALRDRLAELASVSDQSDGYMLIRLSGEDARTVLQRGAAIDFHPEVFAPGAAATTVIAHIGVVIWRRDDDARGRPKYEIATFRSYFDSFRRWLDHTAAAL
ncbi:sarcosine oxidase gamma subunit [Novosphingobium sp. AP12]|nr:sarcosine oxidase gamma subunit [Novosphingobium sp. AP12]